MTSHAMTAPRETRRTRVNTTLGMALFLGSWSMAFATLFLSFLILRHREPAWPPPGVPLPSTLLAGLGTLVLLASSVALKRAVARGKADRPFAGLWGLGLLLGLLFAALQSWLWVDVWSAGVRPDGGNYAALFYMLTWFHALHVACGLLALIAVWIGVLRGRVGALHLSPAIATALFWHFVDAVWVVLFLGFFVF